jgi:hypothetical protein
MMSPPVTTPVDALVAAPRGRPWARAVGWLTRLTDNPVNLWLVMLAVNAVFLPYRSRFHDALLYGFQVQNAAERGRFQDDLFLRYGSQDGYSIFSLAAAPMARAIGLQPALFLLYLLATALFFLAAVRLARRLIPGQSDATVGLLLLAVSQPVVGGLTAIHVNENFLTARLPAEALVLLGLERLVAGHTMAGLLLQLVALTVHPLMAFGGLLVALAWCAIRYIPRRHLASLAVVGALLALAAGLMARAAGARRLMPTDHFWVTEVAIRSPYMFINEWSGEDWVALLVAVLVAAWARYRLSSDPAVAGLLTAVLVVTALAVAGSLAVYYAPFALILQGQPFRAVWLIQALAVLLAMAMARDLWSRGDGPWRGAAVALIWYMGDGSSFRAGLGLTLVFPVVAAWLRGTARTPRDPGWLWRSLAVSLLAAEILDVGVELTSYERTTASLAGLVDRSTLMCRALTIVPPLGRMFVAIAILAVLGWLAGAGRTFRLAALTVFIAVQASWYGLQAPGPSGTWARADGSAVRFLRTYLAAREVDGGRPPTVYWPSGRVDLLWHDLGVNSYYAWYQVAGNVFKRETAVEGRRRADLVRPFEVELGRRRRLLEVLTRPSLAERVYGVGLKDDPPRLADLLRLCADEGVDYAVLRQGFAGWYDAHDGDWFVYDARAVRARARSEGRATGVSMMRPAAIR